MLNKKSFTLKERQAVFALAGIFSLRMLGLFMILPVFTLYAEQLRGANPTTIGVALGIYGLTQASFQLPFGFLSDRFGRKPLITCGLLLFCLGTVIAALSSTIVGVIVGRAIQGAGAVGSVIMALAADLTREETRMRAMAGIGLTIGFSFGLAFILGPLLSAWLGGIQGLFWLTALLALAGLWVLYRWVPAPEYRQDLTSYHRIINIPKTLRVNKLWSLYFGVFVLHASLTAVFLKIPLIILSLGFSGLHTWYFYLPIFLCAMVFALSAIFYAEKYQCISRLQTLSVTILGVAELGFLFCQSSLVGFGISLILFFTAFNFLEASLPALVSKQVSPENRGLAMGGFSSAQFFGLFSGGLLGGWLDSQGGSLAVIIFCVILATVWLVWIYKRGLYGKRNQ